MELIRVSEHQDIKGNEKGDECVVFGSTLDEIMACNDVLMTGHLGTLQPNGLQ